MLVWITIFGAVAGWALADFESFGAYLGGFVGFGFAWVLRRSIRAEIANATDALLMQFEARFPAASAPRSSTSPETDRADADGAVDRRPAAEERREAPSAVAARTVAAPPSARSPEPMPSEPGIVALASSAAIAAARNWLFGGNTIVRVGLIVLFVGLSFLASYAASAGLFPVEMRLALVAAFGAGLLIFGFRTRTERPGFGLALQGAGVASIYLTLFAAARLVDGFSLGAALALMILVCALGCALALLQRSQALAVTAFAGGFAVPLLLSTGGGDVTVLFAYYTLLNIAILFIAGQRSWRVLNLVGFLSTFGLLTLWVADGYVPAQFVVTQIFLIVSVLIYVAAAVLYTRDTAGRIGNAVDTTLLFGPALAGFGLEVELVGDRPFGSAFAALGFAALYIAVAAFTARRRPESARLISEAMLAIGIGFVTLAVPLAFGARWTSAAWALEGAGALWIGMRQARWLPRMFGIALQAVAGIVYLSSTATNISAVPLANPAFMGAMLIALAVLATAWWLRRDMAQDTSRFAALYARYERVAAKPAFVIGFGFWWIAWAAEATRMTPPLIADAALIPVFAADIQVLLTMVAFVASAWGFQTIGRRKDWPVAVWPSLTSLGALVLGFLASVDLQSHILYLPGCVIWVIAIGLHGRMLFLNDRESTGAKPLRVATHVGGVWLATAMLADCLWLAIDKAALWNSSWAGVVFLASVVAVLAGLTLWATRAIGGGGGGGADSAAVARRWPLDRHALAYGWLAALPIAVLTYWAAISTALFASGDADPLPYLPILNPVDLMLAAALAVLILWRSSVIAARPLPVGAAILRGAPAIGALAILAFVAINTVWLRIAHQLLGVDWDPDALFDSVVVQTGFAILWTGLALPLMIIAHRRGERAIWLAGAGLLGLTVVKLLLIDLNNTGGGARIVAFIAVGVLMLVVGYLAPLPPKLRAADTAADERLPV